MTDPAPVPAPSPPRAKPPLASRLTAGCVTLAIILAALYGAIAWWWKIQAARPAPPVPAASAPAVP